MRSERGQRRIWFGVPPHAGQRGVSGRARFEIDQDLSVVHVGLAISQADQVATQDGS